MLAPDHSDPDPSAEPQGWTGTYPALLRCLTRGREPSDLDLEIVAARIWRELGRERSAPWEGLEPRDRRRRRMLALARAALSGGEASGERLRFPLVLRGH